MNKLEKSVALLSLVCVANVDAMYHLEDVRNLREDTAFCQISTVEDAFVHNLNVSTFSSHIFDLAFDISCVSKLNSNDMAIIDVKDSQLQLLGYFKVPANFTVSQTRDFHLKGYLKDNDNVLHGYSVSEKISTSGESIVVFQQSSLGVADNISNFFAENARRRREAREQRRIAAEHRVTGNEERLAQEGVTDFGVNLATAGTNLLNGNFSGTFSSLASSAVGGWNAIKHGTIYCFRRVTHLCHRNEQ